MFQKPTALLFLGSVFAQLVQLVMIPVISRLYSAESFGRFALFQSVLGIVSIGAILKLDLAIVAEPDDQHASKLFSSIVKISIGEFSILFALWAIFVIQQWTLEYLILAFISGISYCVGQAFIQFNLRNQLVAKASVFRFLQALLIAITPLFFILLKDGLIYGTTLGYFLFFILIFLVSKQNLFKNSIDWKDLLQVLKANSVYIKFGLIPALLESACLYLIVHFIHDNWGESNTGLWNMSKQLLSAPTAIVGVVVGQLIISEGASIRTSKVFAIASFWRHLKVLIAVSLAFVVGVILFKDSLIVRILGPKWADAVELVGLLVYPFMAMFLASPLSRLLIVRGKIFLNGLWQTLRFFSILSLVLFEFESFRSFLIIYSIVEISLVSLYLFIIRVEMNKNSDV